MLIDSSVAFALQDAGGYAISLQNNLELHLGCHTCSLSYFTLVCLWCGRTVGRAYGHMITKFSRVDYFIFLPMVLRCARCARFAPESSATNRLQYCMRFIIIMRYMYIWIVVWQWVILVCRMFVQIINNNDNKMYQSRVYHQLMAIFIQSDQLK